MVLCALVHGFDPTQPVSVIHKPDNLWKWRKKHPRKWSLKIDLNDVEPSFLVCVNKESLFGWQMSTGLSGDWEARPPEVYIYICIWEFLVPLTLYLGQDASHRITNTSLVFRSRSHALSGEGFFSVITQAWHIHLQVCFCFFQSSILLGGPNFCETYRSYLSMF